MLRMAFFAKSKKKKVADRCSTLQIPEELVHAAAQGLADSLTVGETERNLLYPDVERVSLPSQSSAEFEVGPSVPPFGLLFPSFLSRTGANVYVPADPRRLDQDRCHRHRGGAKVGRRPRRVAARQVVGRARAHCPAPDVPPAPERRGAADASQVKGRRELSDRVAVDSEEERTFSSFSFCLDVRFIDSGDG